MSELDYIDAFKRQSLEGDTNPAKLTAVQAQKCAAILEAYIDGQTLYKDAVNTVAQFLKAAALEGSLGRGGFSRPSTSALWEHLDVLGWPRHGGSQSQPDIE